MRDRVVQTAATIVLMAIFEADFHPNSFGNRPNRNAQQAVNKITQELYRGRTEVIDADLSAYFDTIPHRKLMRLVLKRVSDGTVLKLIKGWLRASIEEEVKPGEKIRTKNRCGTPQGGVISPILANVFLNDLDHGVNERTNGRASLVR